MHPHFIVLVGFVTRIFALILLISGHIYLSALLLFIGMILDFTDGQFARHTNTTSTLGTLYDVTSDFICTCLLLLCFFYLQSAEASFEVNAVTLSTFILGFFTYYLNIEFWTYISWRQEHGHKHKDPKNFFLSQPINDTGNSFLYDQKLKFMRKIFNLTWIPFGKITFLIPGWKNKLRVKSSLHIFVLGSMTIQTILACFFIIFAWPYYLFFIYQVVLFALFVLLLQFNEAD